MDLTSGLGGGGFNTSARNVPVRGNVPASGLGRAASLTKSGAASENAIGKTSAGKMDTKILSYPEDVTDGIGQGHYIMFEIMQQTKAKLLENK